MDNTNMQVAPIEQKKSSILQVIDVDQIDVLEDAVEIPVNIMSDYWTPSVVGEFKRVIFDCIEVEQVVDQRSGETMELECAYFYVKEDGHIKRIRNGSKRLVGRLQSVPTRTALVIKYLGKVKNKNNSNMSDNWSITPLRYEAKPQ